MDKNVEVPLWVLKEKKFTILSYKNIAYLV
jgi:hypothetical protein